MSHKFDIGDEVILRELATLEYSSNLIIGVPYIIVAVFPKEKMYRIEKSGELFFESELRSLTPLEKALK